MSTEAGSRTVVAGIDGSDSALGAARWAAEYAALHTLPLTLLHVVSKLDELTGGGGGGAALTAAANAARSARPDLVVDSATVTGAVAPALAGAAGAARILVIGAGADRRGPGGHAVRIAHRTECPLVVWRPAVATRTGKPLPVVVGVDDSEPSTRALAEAFGIAAALHAPLQVVHLWEIAEAVGMGDLGGQGNMDWQLLELLQSQQRERVGEAVAPLARTYPNVHLDTVFQDIGAAKGLTELSQSAQLVVVGSHGRGRLAAALLGSVSQSLLHHGECPVMVVR